MVKAVFGPLIAFPSVIVWFYIWNGSREILKISRKKVVYRELMKTLKWRDKLFPFKYIELSIAAKNLQKFFVAMYFIFYILLAILVFLIIYSRYVPQNQFLRYYFIIKGAFIEWPALAVCLYNLSFRSKGAD